MPSSRCSHGPPQPRLPPISLSSPWGGQHVATLSHCPAAFGGAEQPWVNSWSLGGSPRASWVRISTVFPRACCRPGLGAPCSSQSPGGAGPSSRALGVGGLSAWLLSTPRPARSPQSSPNPTVDCLQLQEGQLGTSIGGSPMASRGGEGPSHSPPRGLDRLVSVE